MKHTLMIIALTFAVCMQATSQADGLQAHLVHVIEKTRAIQSVEIVQRYTFSYDSTLAAPFDSGVCLIRKHAQNYHVDFSGVELYTDGKYVVRVSNPSQLLVVSQTKDDLNAAQSLEMIASFTLGFQTSTLVGYENNVVQYQLTGGRYGSRSMVVEIDTLLSRIERVVLEVSGEHPILAQLYAMPIVKRKPVFIRIDYSYSNGNPTPMPRMTDYFSIVDAKIVPAQRYHDYQLQVVE